ncbi:MAG: hypothetical protein Q8N45_11280 [Anaerolineales bacterium]|nr:hypothetical protein [Anaerolineales bacterium]
MLFKTTRGHASEAQVTAFESAASSHNQKISPRSPHIVPMSFGKERYTCTPFGPGARRGEMACGKCR